MPLKKIFCGYNIKMLEITIDNCHNVVNVIQKQLMIQRIVYIFGLIEEI